MNKMFFYAPLFLFLGTACAASPENIPEDPTTQAQCTYAPYPKASRQVGMDILNTLPNSNYDANLQKLLALGGTYQHFSINWSAIEGSGNGAQSGQLEDSHNYLSMMNAVAESSHTKITLIIRPIDTTGKTVPSDLMNADFNSPEMIARFKNALDFTLTKIKPDNLVDVMIGNEVDTYNPNGDENFWIEYANFLSAIKTYSNQKYPSLKIGFVTTLNGATQSSTKTADGWPAREVIQTLAKFVNVVGVTYYPLSPDFSVKPMSSVKTDIKNLVESLPTTTPIHFTEVGFPSSPSNKSNDATQAQFFCEFMHVWDMNTQRIPYVSFLRLNDIPQNQADDMSRSYGLGGSKAFVEYLRTLGLSTENGDLKPAYYMLSEELKKRKF